MILAAASHAEGDGPPPRELELALQAELWRALPNAGGLLDQPAGLLDRMTISLNTYRAVSSWKARDPGKEKDWKAAHPTEWDIVMAVRKLRRGANS